MSDSTGWYDRDLKKTLGMLKLKSSLLYVNFVYVITWIKSSAAIQKFGYFLFMIILTEEGGGEMLII